MSGHGLSFRAWLQDERSVTPVVGTILTVAILVILAAVVGATTLGYADKLAGTEQASAGQCGVVEFDPENVDAFAKDRSEVYDVDCIMWFDAGSLAYEDGDTVTRWNDRSASRFDATGVSGLNNPTWNADINGIEAVEFDGSDGLSTEASASDVGLDDDPAFTVSTVVWIDSSHDGTISQFGIPTNSNFRGYFRFGYNDGPTSTTPWYVTRGFDGGGFIGHRPTESNSVGTWNLITYVHDSDDNQIIVYRNGEQVDQFPTDYDITNDLIKIGYETDESGAIGGSVFQGAIAEMVVFNKALTKQERESVECQMVEEYDGEISATGC